MKDHRMKIWFAGIVILFALSLIGSVSAQDGIPKNYPRWLSMGGVPGTNRQVLCSTVDPAGNLYVGGEFTMIDDLRSFGVAKWDGTKWWGISPPTASGQTVEAMATDAAGNLYVGGSFRDFGGLDALRIAKWDGSRWHTMGAGLGYNGTAASQKVKSIAVSPSGVVYAGGVFTESNGVTVNNIARWDGSHWQPLGPGFNGGFSTEVVNAMAFDAAGNLYVTGKFSYFGDNTPINGIAMWDGTSWSNLSTGLTGSAPISQGCALVFDTNGDLIVGGEFKNAGGLQVNNIARWNGSSWSAFGTAGAEAGIPVGSSKGVRALRISAAGEVIAASKMSISEGSVFYQMVRWDGSNWLDAIPFPAKMGEIRTFAIMPNGDFIIGGAFKSMGTGANEFHASHLVRWDGTGFHRFGSGPDAEILAAKFDSNDDLIVAGNFQTIGDIQASRIARFDGTRWWPYGTGLDGAVHAIELGENGKLYAAGEFLHAGSVATRTIAHWDGTQWISMEGGLTQTGTVPIVRAMALGANSELYVGGEFASSVSGVELMGVGLWKEGGWHSLDGGCRFLDGGPRSGRVESLLIDGQGNLVAGGYFQKMGIGSGNTAHLAQWDGTKWTSVGPTVTNERPFRSYGINTMSMNSSGVLHVAYNNTITDGHSLVRLVSNTWQTVGNGFSGKPYSMVFDDDGGIYAGGTLTLTGVPPRQILRGITYWNGNRWSSYGNEGLGMVNLTSTETVEVRALAKDTRGNLIIGGKFLGSYSGVVSPFLIRTQMGGYGVWPQLGGLPADQLGPLDSNGPLDLRNLTAYAMGIDPLVAQSGELPQLILGAEDVPPASRSADHRSTMATNESMLPLRFQYRRNRNARGISMEVETSNNLVDWTRAEILSSVVMEQHLDWERVEITVPRSDGKLFLRIATELTDQF